MAKVLALDRHVKETAIPNMISSIPRLLDNATTVYLHIIRGENTRL
jgi:hypothetical protein